MVRLRDVLAYRIVRLVKEEEVDFGIGTLRMPDPDIQFTPLFTDHLGVIFPAGHPVERRRTITLKYLTAFPLILMDPETSVRDLVDHAFESIGEVAVPAFEAVYPSTALALVKAGLGLTIQPSSSMELASSKGPQIPNHQTSRAHPADRCDTERPAIPHSFSGSIHPGDESSLQIPEFLIERTYPPQISPYFLDRFKEEADFLI